MKFKELKNQIKEDQKQLAQEIKKLKATRKQTPYGYVSGLDWKQHIYRHKHIAYCQFFNRTPYEKIERSCYEDPNTSTIDNHTKEWYITLEEDVRNCA